MGEVGPHMAMRSDGQRTDRLLPMQRRRREREATVPVPPALRGLPLLVYPPVQPRRTAVRHPPGARQGLSQLASDWLHTWLARCVFMFGSSHI
jgi:hypothetical protein